MPQRKRTKRKARSAASKGTGLKKKYRSRLPRNKRTRRPKRSQNKVPEVRPRKKQAVASSGGSSSRGSADMKQPSRQINLSTKATGTPNSFIKPHQAMTPAKQDNLRKKHFKKIEHSFKMAGRQIKSGIEKTVNFYDKVGQKAESWAPVVTALAAGEGGANPFIDEAAMVIDSIAAQHQAAKPVFDAFSRKDTNFEQKLIEATTLGLAKKEAGKAKKKQAPTINISQRESVKMMDIPREGMPMPTPIQTNPLHLAQ